MSDSDSEDDEDESDDDDEDESEETLSLFLFFFFLTGVLVLIVGEFSVKESGHLGEVEDFGFGSGFSSSGADCVICVCSGSSFCSGFVSVSRVLASVSISSTLELVFSMDTSGDGVGGAV